MNGEEEIPKSIPFDLIIELLTRLPAKSITRFRCLSKLCDSTLRGTNFTDSFFTIYMSLPKLLFTCLKDDKTFFFSSPQPQNSSPLAANFQMSIPSDCPSFICLPVRGLVCGLNKPPLKRTVSVPLICNPSSGQFFTVPKVEWTREVSKICLGYDPIDKQFKVLCRTVLFVGSFEKYQVLTLGSGKKLSWRMIKCDIPHYPFAVDCRNDCCVYDEICINGVCYSFARLRMDDVVVIVCFDIRFEKFNSIRIAQDMRHGLRTNTLVNYKDKLAKLQLNIDDGICVGIQLWVLEDAEKHEWSSHIYVLPPPWKNIFKKDQVTYRWKEYSSTSEIVLSPGVISDSFYLLYYNPERNTRVEIQGMEAFEDCQLYTFLDHVEDVKIMTSV